VKAWADSGVEGTMCTARPGWQTMSLRIGKYKKTSRNIRIDLYDISEVDTVNKVYTILYNTIYKQAIMICTDASFD
jgi:Delta24-sterol reductase